MVAGIAPAQFAGYLARIMNARLRLILVLWAASAVAGSALAGDPGCCDPLCCDEPCGPASPGPDPCSCCALSGPVSDDPGLPASAVAKAAPTPVADQAPVDPVVDAPAPAPGPVAVVTIADPPPSRPTVLRI